MSLTTPQANLADTQAQLSAAIASLQAAETDVANALSELNAPTPTPSAPLPTPTVLAGLPLKLVFDEEFATTSLDTTVWNSEDGYRNKNNTTIHAANTSVSNGICHLAVPVAGSGAEVSTRQPVFTVGDIIEYKVFFPGSGQVIYNWPAVWTSGPTWPQDGEYDWAEGLGNLTMNIHGWNGSSEWTSNGLNPSVPGTFGGVWMTVTGQRLVGKVNTWWNQIPVRQGAATRDNGSPHQVILTAGDGNQAVYGSAGTVQIAYVRIWTPS